MRTNKFAILFIGPLTFISLATAILFYINRYTFEAFEFIANIFSGIFASGLLALALAIIGYLEDRRKTLGKFYTYAQKAVLNFNRYENDNDIEQIIDIILLMDEFDYAELGNAYEDISFLIYNQKLRDYIYHSIYGPIINLANLIRKNSYYFKLYKKQLAKDGQHAKLESIIKKFIDEIDSAIMSRTIREIPNDDGTVFRIPCSENKIVPTLRKELGGKYYSIMYPCKKGKEVPPDAD